MAFELSRSDVELIINSIVSKYLSQKRSHYFALYAKYEGRGFLNESPFYCDSLDMVSLAIEVGDFFGVTQSGLEEHFIRYKDLTSWVDIVCDSLKHYNASIIFQTSGTTGQAKRVEHKMSDLLQEVEFLASLFPKTQHIDAFVRVHHIYGFLFSILLPKVLSVACKYHEPLPSNSLFTKFQNSLVVATPTLYSNLSLVEGSFLPDTLLASSTQALTQESRFYLQERGAKEVYEFYGSSESLGLGYKKEMQAPFTLFDYLHKERLIGVQDELEFVDANHFYVKNRKDQLVKHRGYKLDLESYEAELNGLKSVQKAKVSLSKGLLVCFITSLSKESALDEIAQNLEIKPDQIVWME